MAGMFRSLWAVEFGTKPLVFNFERIAMLVKKHLGLLGLQVEDRVTGFTGVVVSVSFDLFGCIQAVVRPAKTAEGKLEDSHWFDIARLRVTGSAPVMEVPNFDFGDVAKGLHGPAEKPKQTT